MYTTTLTLNQQQNDWHGFYVSRINSGYQDYFEERYKDYIQAIIHLQPTVVKEEGIGIGSVSKALRKMGIDCYGSDVNTAMVELAMKNNPGLHVFKENILHYPQFGYREGVVATTHGVLEHFSDEQIDMILAKYKMYDVKSVHYVPTDGYDTPSFGDERLMSPLYWVKRFKPTDYFTFNSDKDLCLIF